MEAGEVGHAGEAGQSQQAFLINDLAIVSTLELELSGGMTTLTGETGAGKSILIDALGLTLGDKTDNAMIRPGGSRPEIGNLAKTARRRRAPLLVRTPTGCAK